MYVYKMINKNKCNIHKNPISHRRWIKREQILKPKHLKTSCCDSNQAMMQSRHKYISGSEVFTFVVRGYHWKESINKKKYINESS